MGCCTHQTQALPRNKNVAQTLAQLLSPPTLRTFWPVPASSKTDEEKVGGENFVKGDLCAQL